MQLARLRRTSDPLGRYYTDSHVGSLLVGAVNASRPKIVIDLGAGGGALIGAAAEIWTDARFITVDIDKNAGSARYASSSGLSFRHHHADALNEALPEMLGLGLGAVDVALCNPPYVRPKWHNHFHEILEDAGLSGLFNIRDIPAPLLFIAQNLRLLKPGGKLGLILPDGIMSGEKFAPMRRALIRQHRLERVIELPRRIFNGTDAKTHIAILTKSGVTGASVKVQRLQDDGAFSTAIALPVERAERRLDYSYVSTARESASSADSGFALGSVASKVVRGAHSSVERRSISAPIFHTSDFPAQSEESPPKFQLKDLPVDIHRAVVAEAGDILIARVGRNLGEKVCIVKQGPVVISDCVFLLRVVPAYRARVFAFLRSPAGFAALQSSAHGVSAKFLSTRDVLQLRII